MIPRLPLTEQTSRLTRDFLAALAAQGFSGELRHDFGTRLVTATDNSIYQITPQAVVYPRNAEDVQRTLRLASQPRFQDIKITARGGGTGTNGQSLSEGIILDCSRHLNQILAINVEEGWVRVQPGVVLDQLNDQLAPHGVFFAPNLSPSSRATLGGMINTDACGKGSRIYGRTSDHVLELTCVLSDGSKLDVEPWEDKALSQLKSENGLAGSAIRVVDEIVTEKAEVIERVFPKLSRFLTGYNLAKVYGNDDGRFNLNYLLAGSEGTLAVITEAKLRLTLLPRHKELLVVKYESFDDALTAAELLVESNPAAIETIDEKILELAKEDEIYPLVRDFLTDEGTRLTRTINLVEFIGNSPEELVQEISELCERLDANRSEPGQATGYYRTTTPSEMGDLWNLRKKGVGLLGNTKGARKPIPFVEDTCVPPKNLAAYIREFRALLESYGLDYAMFGHVDVGCLHVRPALDLKEPEQERWLREISDGVMQLVRKHGGVMWGEHGRGFRSEYTPEFFGELYPELRRIKEAFDPCNRLNPGKIVTPLSSSDEPVGVEAPLRGQQDRQIHPDLHSEFDAVVSCNGNGACFNYQPHDVMCPSSRVTRDRRHSPKGRAGLLREWLRQLSLHEGQSSKVPKFQRDRVLPTTGHRPPQADWLQKLQNLWHKQQGESDFSHEVYEAMSGCLACKACATQCPIHVDIPEFRAKFLEAYHTRYLRPLRDYFVGSTEWSGRWLSRIPALANTLLDLSASQVLLRKFGLVDVPRFSPESTWARLHERGVPTADPDRLHRLSPEQKSVSVALTLDAFTAFYESPVVLDLYDLLLELGFRVYLAPFRPNGKPLHVKGFLHSFHKTAEKNADHLRKIAETGVPLLGIDPSVVLTYRDEYPKILAQADLGFSVLLPQEFLLQHPERLAARKSENRMASQPYQLFGHCMEKTGAQLSQKQWQELFRTLGLDLTLVAVGCCGMAGTYGHEREHQAESRGIFEMSWQQRLPEDALARQQVLATGYSCRSQTKRFAGFVPRHPMQALLAELRHAKLPRG